MSTRKFITGLMCLASATAIMAVAPAQAMLPMAPAQAPLAIRAPVAAAVATDADVASARIDSICYYQGHYYGKYSCSYYGH